MPKTSFGKNVYGPDPSFVEGLSNIAAMFDPKAEAEGAFYKARANYYGESVREKAAQAELLANRNRALNDSYLAGAGYNPQQIAAIRAAQSDSVADIFRGVNYDKGANMLSTDPRMGLMFMGQASAATQPDAVFSQAGADAYNQAKRSAARHNVDPISEANKTYELQDKLNKGLIAAVSPLDKTGKSYQYLPDPEQSQAITGYALKLIQSGTPVEDALRFSAQAHGVSNLGQGSLVPEIKPGMLWDSETGRYLFNGFRNPDIASTVASQANPAVAPAVNQSAPVAPNAIPQVNTPVAQPLPQAAFNAPAGAIQRLKSNPELKNYFDEKYGQGASDFYLSQ